MIVMILIFTMLLIITMIIYNDLDSQILWSSKLRLHDLRHHHNHQDHLDIIKPIFIIIFIIIIIIIKTWSHKSSEQDWFSKF